MTARNFLVFIFWAAFTIKGAGQIPLIEPVKFLALGDSYTYGQGVATSERWPSQLIRRLQDSVVCLNPRIIAMTGWRTDQLLSAIETIDPPKDYTLASLLIGVNNLYQNRSIDEYATAFEILLQKAIEHTAGISSRVFVLSIPDYGYTPFGQSDQETISDRIDEFNNVNKEITESYGVTYIDVTASSRKGLDMPELVASDGLHPSGELYKIWVDSIFNHILFDVEVIPVSIEAIPVDVKISRIESEMQIDIAGSKPESIYLELLALDGRVLQTARRPRIDVTNLRGIYILKIMTRSKMVTRKIFIE